MTSSTYRIDEILEGLRASRYRLTKGRMTVIEQLAKSEEPLGALELHAKLLRSKTAIDKVTVYRELQFLTRMGIAHEVHLNDSIVRYELAPEHGHKHHLICTSCKTVEDVSMNHDDLAPIERQIGQRKKFSIKSHSLEFYGLCNNCQ